MPRLRFETLPISSVTDLDAQRLFSLFQNYYVDVTFSKFHSDLKEKSHVMILLDPAKKSDPLIGFSTIMEKVMIIDNRKVICLFSGDTVVKKEYWGTKVLQKAFFRYILFSSVKNFMTPVFWMLMSKGHKTYLMMRRNFPQSYPQLGSETPERFQKIKDAFYSEKFGTCYNPEKSVIEFTRALGAVHPDIACPSPDQVVDKDVQYFLEKNPGYARGVELACITRITAMDLLRTMIKHGLGIRRKPRSVFKPAKGFEEAI